MDQSLTRPGYAVDLPRRPAPKVEIVEPPGPQADDSIEIQSFEISGNTLFTEGELRPLVQPLAGRRASPREAAARIAAKYREAGYTLVRVSAEAKGPVVTLRVNEGRIDRVLLAGNRSYSTEFLRNYLDPLKDRPSLDGAGLDRAFLLLGDYPGLTPRAVVRQEGPQGGSDLYVWVDDTLPWALQIEYNNLGSPLIDRNRFGASIDLADLWHLGHEVELRGVIGDQPQNVGLASLMYSVPLDTTGLKISGSFGWMNFEAAGIVPPPAPFGDGWMYAITLSYPVVKTRSLEIVAGAGFEGRDIEEIVQGARIAYDHLRVFRYQATLDAAGDDGRWIAQIEFRHGCGSLFGGTQAADLPSRPGASDWFAKVSGRAFRVQRVNESVRLVFKAAGQIATDPLLVSEQFAMGGFESVRGYDYFEYGGDWAYVLSAEARVAPPGLGLIEEALGRKLKDELEFVFFFDHGEAGLRSPGTLDRASVEMDGAGIGLRYSGPRFSFRVDVGWPVARLRPSNGDTYVVHAQAVIQLDAKTAAISD